MPFDVRRPRRALAVLAAGAALALGVGACGGSGDDEATRPTTGRGIYRAYCLTCHGADGQGGVGPRLAGVVADKYPDVAAQVAVVANGTGRMPAFRGTLTPDEIRQVVEYERTDLGT